MSPSPERLELAAQIVDEAVAEGQIGAGQGRVGAAGLRRAAEVERRLLAAEAAAYEVARHHVEVAS